MKYLRSRYFSSLELLSEYTYPTPFHLFSKQFFKANKKFGSKDRRAIADICYNYFRMGVSLHPFSIKEGLLISLLTHELDNYQDWLKLRDELGVDVNVDLSDNRIDFSSIMSKPISFYKDGFLMREFNHYNLSENQNFRPKNWAKDHNDDETGSLGLLGAKEINVNENLLPFKQVQDLSSQFLCSKISIEDNYKVWDICCGAGGKSLNLSSRKKGKFYLSDIRPSIIKNAESRMNKMHYDAKYAEIDISFHTDNLRFDNEKVNYAHFDTIIADVPCSGSGTWFRTPEHFMNFDYNSIANYTNRQKAIVENAIPFLKVGGTLYYMTCSVFEEENTNIKQWIIDNFSVSLQDEIMFDGIRHRSDAMYMSSFKKLD